MDLQNGQRVLLEPLAPKSPIGAPFRIDYNDVRPSSGSYAANFNPRKLALPGMVWLHSLAVRDAGRVEVEPAAVEVDRLAEARSVPEAA